MRQVNIATAQFLQLLNYEFRGWVHRGGDAQRDQRLFQVQAHRLALQHILFEMVERSCDEWRQQVDVVGDVRQRFDRVENEAGGGVHVRGVLTGNDASVFELDGGATVKPVRIFSFGLRISRGRMSGRNCGAIFCG